MRLTLITLSALLFAMIMTWYPHSPDNLMELTLPEAWWNFYNFYVGYFYINTGYGLSWMHIA